MNKPALVTLLVIAAAASAGAPQAQEAPRGDAARGRQLYLAGGCFECHGRAGQGGAFNGPAPALAQTPLPYVSFQAQLRNPYGDMPPYAAKVMPDQDVADVFAFVRSLPGARAPQDVGILSR